MKRLIPFLLLLTFAPAWAQDDLFGEYNRKPSFKAIGAPLLNGSVVDDSRLGFAWGYDTAREAVDAALAYCQANQPPGPRLVQCGVIRLGDWTVQSQTVLPKLEAEYEEKELARLERELKRTGERELITRLSTVYQKIGKYAESEALLIELAMDGEHLAQNALAYHWAELNKKLEHALLLVNSAIEQDPDFFSYRDTKALVLTRLDRLREAEESSRLAVELDAHPIALDHLGDILWLRGKEDEARAQWALAVGASRNILFKQRVEDKIRTGKTGDIVFE